ncbi:uncharacterized protein LOC124448360 [Xenia sp. Carnegie-2017]|uniref:uncharacterized protein LOC124448360 n=1 Tax=Xenia sp. Carnegie-2017 TaxID=2897299 RepID=UPI001F043C9B|nr:uncharacterized protein LOC124448360 [Xenia sp. Carnegie-2017]
MEVKEESLRSFNLLIKNVEKNVEHFITHDENQCSEILSGLREIYYLTKKEEAVCGRSIKGCPFERLQLDDTNFDVEIIWQQIQLQNECLLPKLSVEVKTLTNGTVFLRKNMKILAADVRTNKMESDSQILAQSDSEKGGSKSTLEKQQEKVKKQIAALEQSNIATKSWQLSGETSHLYDRKIVCWRKCCSLITLQLLGELKITHGMTWSEKKSQ